MSPFVDQSVNARLRNPENFGNLGNVVGPSKKRDFVLVCVFTMPHGLAEKFKAASMVVDRRFIFQTAGDRSEVERLLAHFSRGVRNAGSRYHVVLV